MRERRPQQQQESETAPKQKRVSQMSTDSLDDAEEKKRQLPVSKDRRSSTMIDTLATLLAVLACLVFVAAKLHGVIVGSEQEWVDLVLVKAWDIVPLYGNIACMVLLRVFDAFFAPNGARWFAIHAFANLIVVVFCIQGLFAVRTISIHINSIMNLSARRKHRYWQIRPMRQTLRYIKIHRRHSTLTRSVSHLDGPYT